MKISVVIPAYNASATIKETLDSVLAQTRQPEEILVMDDGSTDNTAAIVASYGPRITLMLQVNSGPGAARNALCAAATGNLIAFLDSDDLWHARYLEVQHRLCLEHPECMAFFVGHMNFHGIFRHDWDSASEWAQCSAQIISPLDFLRRILWEPAPFNMSYCCIPRAVLSQMGAEPFQLRMAEDLYFHCRRAPLGPVVYLPVPLAAYRLRDDSLSSSNLKLAEGMTQALELCEGLYNRHTTPALRAVFRESLAMKRRHYAKLLMGIGDTANARKQLTGSVACCSNPLSVIKSLALLVLAHAPSTLQPRWPSAAREGGTDGSANPSVN